MENTVDILNNICHGKGKDKEKELQLLEIIKNNNLKKRLDIANLYYRSYGKSLYEDLKSGLSGDYIECARQMFLSPLDMAVKTIEFGVDKKKESPIYEMITPRNLEEIRLIEEAYKKDTEKDLREDLKKILKDPVKKNVMNIFTTQRGTNTNPNNSECERCANTLAETAEKNWIEDENLFREIFLKKSPEELVIIARYYLKKTGKNLSDVVDKLDKGPRTLIREILYNNIMPHEISAEKIYLAIKGAGTDEDTLSRILVTRCELDMQKIREMYFYKYKVTMKEDIIGDTSGNYQKICLYLGEK